VNQVSQTVASGLIASYGREQELQADGLGAEYLARNAYDPRIMIKVIKVLQDQERFAADQARAEGRPVPAPSNWLASHPSNDQRLQTITELAGQYPAKSRDSYADEGRARYLQAISGMDFGDSAAQGVTRGRNFYHAALGIAITAPPGWKIQNEATQLMLVNAARDAALVMKTAPAPAGKSQDEIIRALLKPSQGRSERLTLNGLPATHFVGARTNAQGQTLTLEATLVSGPAQALFLLNYSARDATALQRARPQLQEAQNSFRPLTASEQAAARAWTLKTVPYPRGGFAELARSSPLEQAEPQLRLINGFYGGGVPQTGQLVKTIATP
jgi:predicted Zn-dependent protease